MKDKKQTTKVKTFFKVLLIILTITRLWTISLFYLFGNNSEITNKIVNDSFHHYQVGILLIAASYLLRKMFRLVILLTIGFGIFLEEWPIFLNDLGFKTNYLYHSKIDFIFIFSLIVLAYFIFFGLLKIKKYA